MHEANLHHLIADITIRRGDWDGYLAECEYNGGAAALEFAERVRELEVGPDYDGLPMTRRLLERARGLVVHSEFVAREMRAQGFTGPIAVIPHGAWIPETDRNGPRASAGRGRDDAADRRLRISEALQEDRGIAAGAAQAGESRSARAHDSGGRAASGVSRSSS